MSVNGTADILGLVNDFVHIRYRNLFDFIWILRITDKCLGFGYWSYHLLAGDLVSDGMSEPVINEGQQIVVGSVFLSGNQNADFVAFFALLAFLAHWRGRLPSTFVETRICIGS